MSDLQTLNIYDDNKIIIDENDDVVDFSEIEAIAHNKDDIIANYILILYNTHYQDNNKKQ